MANKLVRQVLYRLKRNKNWSATVTLTVASDTYDLETGDITAGSTVYTIKHVIVLPANLSRDFVYDLAFIAANKNFTMGGFYDQQDRVFIIDKREIKAYTPTQSDFINHNGVRYNIIKVSVTEDDSSYLVQAKNAEGEA